MTVAEWVAVLLLMWLPMVDHHECPNPDSGYIPAYWHDIMLDHWTVGGHDRPPEGIQTAWDTLEATSWHPYSGPDGDMRVISVWARQSLSGHRHRVGERLRDPSVGVLVGNGMTLFPIFGTCVWTGGFSYFSGARLGTYLDNPRPAPIVSHPVLIKKWLDGGGIGVIRDYLVSLFEIDMDRSYDKSASKALRAVYERLTEQRPELTAEVLRRVEEQIDSATWHMEFRFGVRHRTTIHPPSIRDYYVVTGVLPDGSPTVRFWCLMQPVEGPRGPRGAFLGAQIDLEAIVRTVNDEGEIDYYAGSPNIPAANFGIGVLYGDDVGEAEEIVDYCLPEGGRPR